MKSIKYLRRKLALLDERPVRRWPRWENDDYIAVQFLLDGAEELERQLEIERQRRLEAEEAVRSPMSFEDDDDPEED